MTARLTRSERKAETKGRLLEAAATVFARRGYHAASVEEIAVQAGFTKGAVYSNFATKEDLFLALLDRRFEARVAALYESVEAERTMEAQAQAAGRRFVDFLEQEPEWSLLFVEFWAYAVRDPELRAKLAASYERIHAAVTHLIEQRARSAGVAAVPARRGRRHGHRCHGRTGSRSSAWHARSRFRTSSSGRC